jgi:hypothetical protein
MTTGTVTLPRDAWTNRAMVAVMLAIGIANLLWAERLTVQGGLGWDGEVYARWARDFYDAVVVERIPGYYTGRILPAAIIHYSLRLANLPITAATIIAAFGIYNLVLLLAGVWMWGRIADTLRIDRRGKWVGFSLLFLSYAVLKTNFYQPVLTDTSAFVLGIAACYCYFAGRPAGLLAVMAAGAFTWPTMPLIAGLLYVFPHQPGVAGESTGRDAVPPRARHIATWGAVAIAGAAALAYGFLLTHDFATRVWASRRIVRMDLDLIAISIVAALAYLFVASRRVLEDPRLSDPARFRPALDLRRCAIAALVLAIAAMATHQIANGQSINFTAAGFAAYTFLTAAADPLIFLVAHAVYFGPAIPLLALLWTPFCRSLGDFSIGLRVVVLASVVLALNSQSRQQINVVPLFVVVLVRVLHQRGISAAWPPAAALLCIACSKVWYVFNTGPQIDDGTQEVLLRFPLQHLFMSSGPWMSRDMYFIQGALVCALTVFLYVTVVRRRTPRAPGLVEQASC